MKITKTVLQSLFTLILLLSQSLAFAAIPTTLNYQGHLTDSAGAPVDGAVNVTFQIYNVSAGGLSIWADTYPVTVNQGVFSTELGAAPNPIPAVFFEVPLWIGITVAPDLDEMIPRRPITTNGYSFKAGDANTLEGISASALDQSAHLGNNSNPHSVTAAQTGAASTADITVHSGDTSAHHSKTGSFPELSGQIADAQIPALIARDAEITWNNLTGKPAGFSDDVDNDSGGDITAVTAGSGLIGGGTSGGVTLSHTDTSSQSSINNSSGTVIQDIILDALGHLTGITSANLDSRYFTEIESNTFFLNVAGDTMTGKLNLNISTSEVMNIDSSSASSWLRWEENSVTRGFIGYSSGNTLWASGEIADAFLVRGDTALQLGDNTNSTVTMTIDNGRVGIGTNVPDAQLSLGGTGSLKGIKLGQHQTTPASLYHTTTALRIVAPNDRLQFGSIEYIEDCGGSCIAFSTADVGFGTDTPAVRVHINDSTDASLANGSGALLIGAETGVNLIMDNNEIIARSNGVAAPLYLNKDGTFVIVPGLQITGGADLVEPFDVVSSDLDDLIKPGMVVSIDPDQAGKLKVAQNAYDRTVAGIISGANGINPGLSMAQQGSIADGSHPVALTGRLYALADASYGAIKPGDMLTTSDTLGHVMTVTDHNRAQGAIIGKAMTPLKDGKGYVLILVSLQ